MPTADRLALHLVEHFVNARGIAEIALRTRDDEHRADPLKRYHRDRVSALCIALFGECRREGAREILRIAVRDGE